MVDAIGSFLSLFSQQIWQLNFGDISADRPDNKLLYVCRINCYRIRNRVQHHVQSALIDGVRRIVFTPATHATICPNKRQNFACVEISHFG